MTLAAGDTAGAVRLALAAAEGFESVGIVTVGAGARTIAGRALAQQGDVAAALEQLERASDLLDACGAIGHRDAADRERRRLGQRPRYKRSPGQGDGTGVERLTEREREIARLVVDRRTNGEIAAQLFLGRKTVGTHLRNIFAKLGVSSRVDVARVVEAADREQPAP